jgi:hypothetical protein
MSHYETHMRRMATFCCGCGRRFDEMGEAVFYMRTAPAGLVCQKCHDAELSARVNEP